MFRVIKYLFIVISILVGIVMAIAFFSANEWAVEEVVTIKANSEKVFKYVNSVKKWSEWVAWFRNKENKVEVIYEGPEQGVGAVQKWKDDRMTSVLKIVESKPDKFVKYELVMRNGSVFNGQFRLIPVNTSTQIRWTIWGTSRGFTDRLKMLIFNSAISNDANLGLENLKNLLEGKD
ncbi:MAG TPA: hypothetical protein ENI73_07575 [Spirochaetes bacterium]|nr:hypothetical protein [Spirochaetota bacterium]